MLVIHPDECIDCGVCEPECPVEAILPDTEPGLEKWLVVNAEYAEKWPNITIKKDAPDDAAKFDGEEGKFEKYFSEKNYGSLSSLVTLGELIRRPNLDPVDVLSFEIEKIGLKFLPATIFAVAVSEKYSGYIKRNEIDKKRIDRFNNKSINWSDLANSLNISHECKSRISKVQPETFGQLKRIDGLRPATLAFVARELV